jgi:2-keto-4-pentenoate hydratase/2-oxohepta-3-ene-1,7-dioic acid hydratase in catechol pathway
MHVFGQIAPGDWRYVLAVEREVCRVSATPLSFDSLWYGRLPPEPKSNGALALTWDLFEVPLPDPHIPCWAYALTYDTHRVEARLRDSFRFPKHGPAVRTPPETAVRDTLDYEGEIGLLLHRDRPDRFGYFLANDLTDRGVQVREYTRANRETLFTQAKHFEESLLTGPLLAVGDADDWREIELTVTLNDTLRQRVRAQDCRLTPDWVHADLEEEFADSPWLLVCTGTAEGPIFHSPSLAEKLRLLLLAGFSMKRAREKWLSCFTFLQAGDRLDIWSRTLGRAHTVFRHRE